MLGAVPARHTADHAGGAHHRGDKSIQDYLLYAREFDRKFPGFETDIHGLRFEPAEAERRYLVDCVVGEGGHDTARRQGADDPDPVSQAAEGGRDGRRGQPQTRELLDQIAAENFEVEVSDGYDRDVSEDAAVGAYIGLVDGERLEEARKSCARCAAIGFRTPLWALADSHRIADIAVLDLTGEVDGYIYLGQQTPAFYAKQVVASIIEYGMSLLPPFFGGLMAYDGEANIAFDCPGHQGGQFYRKSPAGQLFFKHFGESIFRNDLCNADVDLGDLLIHEGAGRARRSSTRRRCSAPTRPTSS